MPVSSAIYHGFLLLVGSAGAMALVGFGLGVATDYRGLAGSLARFIAGPGSRPATSARSSTDRFWSILPLSLGIGFPAAVAIGQLTHNPASLIVLLTIVVYYIGMMRLAWLYTPPKDRRVGPLFWTRRAAAMPLAAFFAYGLGLSALWMLWRLG